MAKLCGVTALTFVQSKVSLIGVLVLRIICDTDLFVTSLHGLAETSFFFLAGLKLGLDSSSSLMSKKSDMADFFLDAANGVECYEQVKTDWRRNARSFKKQF